MINIKNVKYALSGAQLYEDFLFGDPLFASDHRPIRINMSWGRYLLAPDRFWILVLC